MGNTKCPFKKRKMNEFLSVFSIRGTIKDLVDKFDEFELALETTTEVGVGSTAPASRGKQDGETYATPFSIFPFWIEATTGMTPLGEEGGGEAEVGEGEAGIFVGREREEGGGFDGGGGGGGGSAGFDKAAKEEIGVVVDPEGGGDGSGDSDSGERSNSDGGGEVDDELDLEEGEKEEKPNLASKDFPGEDGNLKSSGVSTATDSGASGEYSSSTTAYSILLHTLIQTNSEQTSVPVSSSVQGNNDKTTKKSLPHSQSPISTISTLTPPKKARPPPPSKNDSKTISKEDDKGVPTKIVDSSTTKSAAEVDGDNSFSSLVTMDSPDSTPRMEIGTESEEETSENYNNGYDGGGVVDNAQLERSLEDQLFNLLDKLAQSYSNETTTNASD